MLDLPEWFEEFTENLEDESVPAHRDAPASSSREKHSIYNHFPKDKVLPQPYLEQKNV